MRQIIRTVRDWWPILAVLVVALGGLWLYSALHTPDVMDLYSRAWHEAKGGEGETDFYRARLGKRYSGSGTVKGYSRVSASLVLVNVEGSSGIRGNAFLECRKEPDEPLKVGDSISFTAVVEERDLNGTPTVLPRVTEFRKK